MIKNAKSKSWNGMTVKVPQLGVPDLLIGFIVLFVFGLITVFSLQAYQEVQASINTSVDFGSTATASLNDNANRYPAIFDNIVIMAYVLLMMGLILSTFYIDTQPIFFIFLFVLMIAGLLVLLLFSNIYDDLMSDVDIARFAQDFPKLTFLMDNLAVFGIASVFVTLISLYAKQRLFT